MNKVESLKKVAVALGYGSAVSEYTGKTVAKVLKEIAVKMNIVSSTDDIKPLGVADTLNFIAENYGSEENNPYDLVVTETNASVKVKRKNKVITAGTDKLYNGDVLTITAEGNEGYVLDTLTVDGEAIESGSKITVSGKVTIAATGKQE